MMKLNIPDMSCGHCKAAIEKAVTAADAGATLTFDMDARNVDVTSTLETDALLSILAAQGYPASPS